MSRVSSNKGWTRRNKSGLVLKPNEKRPQAFARPPMNEKMRIKMTIMCPEKGCCNAATSSGLCTKHRVSAAVPLAKAAVVSGYGAWKAAGCIGPRPTTRPNPNARETCKARHFYGCGGTPGKYDPETRNQVGRKTHSKACSEAWKAKGGSVRRITTPPAF